MKTNTQTELNTYYQARIDIFSKKENQFRKKSNAYASLRLPFGILIIVALWMTITYLAIHWLIVAFTGIIIYTALVFAQAKVNKQQLNFRHLKRINEQEQSALSGDYTSLPSGSKYIDNNHPFTFDIDIFGNQSLFQYINRTCTSSGEHLLADHLQQKQADVKK